MTYKEIWDTLTQVDVSPYVEKKGNLSYLSWAHAWEILMRHYPDASYEFEHTGELSTGDGMTLMVNCTVTIGECSRTMWLPVMDNRNNAINNPDARQVSDTRMRCLVKCLAMYGLGISVYAGEDVRTTAPQPAPYTNETPSNSATEKQVSILRRMAGSDKVAGDDRELAQYLVDNGCTKKEASDLIGKYIEPKERTPDEIHQHQMALEGQPD